MDRAEAWQLVTEYTTQPHLLRHMLAVEAAMRAYAERFGEDPDLWGLVGLLHDFDYERYPDISVEGHPVVGAKILRERGCSEEVVRAILSHAEDITGVKPESLMERTLVAVDELTGFLVAVALVRPTKSILDVEVKSVRKKWKVKEFAAAVNRQQIEEAAAAINMPLDEHIQVVLDAMKANAEALGLERKVA
ncbi:HDIG domain-containing metalloprotein [Sphaerobacter thermophilus]|uniref:Metal dependent phosphohydrolase n=1 Tax=Sphaerobacter thermophilus (strain ATCC 49802 / DSM 20745 / KCCM 41009 / NCIMB 13125 / S 6022) TaxID=479434 RepID=D1C1E5_SPHTD|nr:HDIG domain-containing metalloprotein [Sphaerobacter thermophilus]ACZ38062.1 metal dependent phosphohydrolase [Sphaerobacter thermophilus DSM 20745]